MSDNAGGDLNPGGDSDPDPESNWNPFPDHQEKDRTRKR